MEVFRSLYQNRDHETRAEGKSDAVTEKWQRKRKEGILKTEEKYCKRKLAMICSYYFNKAQDWGGGALTVQHEE